MPSDRQIQANRENARRSTGPRTPLGKARASLNAVRHGLTARNAVLPQEDHQAYLDLLASLEAQFQPQNPVETFLVQQMASAQWRLLRLARMETGFLMAGIDGVKYEEEHPRRWPECSPNPAPPERSAKKALSEEDEVTRLLGVLFQKNCGMDAFARLSRYENMLNAEYFRALKTLTTLRNAGHKTNPIPPLTPVGQASGLSPAPPEQAVPPASDIPDDPNAPDNIKVASCPSATNASRPSSTPSIPAS